MSENGHQYAVSAVSSCTQLLPFEISLTFSLTIRHFRLPRKLSGRVSDVQFLASSYSFYSFTRLLFMLLYFIFYFLFFIFCQFSLSNCLRLWFSRLNRLKIVLLFLDRLHRWLWSVASASSTDENHYSST